MNTKSILRLLIASEWVLIVFGVYLSFVLEKYLPQELQNYLSAESNTELSRQEDILFIAVLAVAICYFASSILLFFMKNWAKWSYLICIIIFALVLPVTGPTVEHSIADTIGEIPTLISGMILSLIFFTDTMCSNNAEKI